MKFRIAVFIRNCISWTASPVYIMTGVAWKRGYPRTWSVLQCVGSWFFTKTCYMQDVWVDPYDPDPIVVTMETYEDLEVIAAAEEYLRRYPYLRLRDITLH